MSCSCGCCATTKVLPPVTEGNGVVLWQNSKKLVTLRKPETNAMLFFDITDGKTKWVEVQLHNVQLCPVDPSDPPITGKIFFIPN